MCIIGGEEMLREGERLEAQMLRASLQPHLREAEEAAQMMRAGERLGGLVGRGFKTWDKEGVDACAAVS